MSDKVEGEQKLTAMAMLVLSHGGWPLREEEATGAIMRYFINVSVPHAKKLKLMAKLGVVDTKFGLHVATAQRAAETYARAALAELVLAGLAASYEVGPGAAVDTRFTAIEDPTPLPAPKGRYPIYKKTQEARPVLANIATRGLLGRALREEGWP